jgi:tetratricopeptide (TPR) repeat protein
LSPAFDWLDGDLLSASQPTRPLAASWLAWLFLPPAFCLIAISVGRRDRLRDFGGLFRSSRRTLSRALDQADSHEAIARALEDYLNRKFGSNGSVNPRSWAAGQIRACGRADLAAEVERLFADCDKGGFGGFRPIPLDALKSRVIASASDLAPLRTPPARRFPAPSRIAGVGLIVLVSVAAGRPGRAADRPASVALSEVQIRALIDEAAAGCRRAQAAASPDRERAFTAAADKLELVIAAGVTNDRLYCNLANARLESGQYGAAIANFRRALRYDPTHDLYRHRLQAAEQALAAKRGGSGAATGFPLERLAGSWARSVPTAVSRAVLLLSWTAIWVVAALRFAAGRLANWKFLTAALLLSCVAAGFVYGVPVYRYTRSDTAVLSVDGVTLRAGDTDDAEPLVELPDSEGMVVTILQHRGPWYQVRLDDERRGWVSEESIEVIAI